MTYAYVKLGNTGLCNMLFPWARALVYCRNTGSKLIAPLWTKIWRIGPWLRREKDKRYYVKTFTNKSYCNCLLGEMLLRLCPDRVKIFSGMDEYFDEFLQYREYIKEELVRIVNPSIIEDIRSRKTKHDEFIGCHIRRGDFKCSGHDVPNEWYANAIHVAKQISGIRRVLIFTDANADEIASIIEEDPDAILMPPAPAIEDLLLLSQAKFCVCTKSSTFSMWAVYLGQMRSVWHSGETPPQLYTNDMNPIII